MKFTLKIASLILATAFAGATPAAVFAESAPKKNSTEQSGVAGIEFVEKEYNFGTIPENGGPVTHFFEFTNTGTSPLVIISAIASCGCTRPTYPTEPIAPGKKGKIKVTFLPEGRPGEFDKVVKVRSNAKDQQKISLKIRGTVSMK